MLGLSKRRMSGADSSSLRCGWCMWQERWYSTCWWAERQQACSSEPEVRAAAGAARGRRPLQRLALHLRARLFTRQHSSSRENAAAIVATHMPPAQHGTCSQMCPSVATAAATASPIPTQRSPQPLHTCTATHITHHTQRTPQPSPAQRHAPLLSSTEVGHQGVARGAAQRVHRLVHSPAAGCAALRNESLCLAAQTRTHCGDAR